MVHTPTLLTLLTLPTLVRVLIGHLVVMVGVITLNTNPHTHTYTVNTIIENKNTVEFNLVRF